MSRIIFNFRRVKLGEGWTVNHKQGAPLELGEGKAVNYKQDAML